MATGVLCSVVHLADHPPPVHIPMAERLSLPTATRSQHVPRRAGKENHGGFRWHRPAFQPFQLKPWVRDPEVETELRVSLAVIGPNSKTTPMPRITRSLTAPPVTVSSMTQRRTGSGGLDTKHATLKTVSSGPNGLRELLTPATRRGVATATFPVRPPLSRGKQIPGRFFPKPMLTEEQKTQMEMFRQLKPRKAFSRHSATHAPKSADASSDRVFNTSASVSRAELRPSQSGKAQPEVQNQRPEPRAEVFAICFKQDPGGNAYDPQSELHSDYYSIKRLKIPPSTHPPRQGWQAKVPTTNATGNDGDDFAVVLRGHRKHLHKKLLLSAESTESLVEPMTSFPASRAAAGTGGDTDRRSVPNTRETPRKVIDIETPKAGEHSDDDDDRSDDDGEQDEPDNTLAPLNSPTDQRDAFPALV